MIKPKLYKKGIFITLTSVLLLSVIIFIYFVKVSSSKEISDVNFQYSKHQITTNYISDFEKVYLRTAIKSSEKFAMIGLSDYVNTHGNSNIDLERNLTRLVLFGNLSDSIILLSKNQTLTGLIDSSQNLISTPVTFKEFNFIVYEIKHKDNWTITVNSNINFTIIAAAESFTNITNITWKNSINYSTDIIVNGLIHPAFNKKIAKDFWLVNSTQNNCYLYYINKTFDCVADDIKTIYPISP